MQFVVRLAAVIGTLLFCGYAFATPRIAIIIDDLGRDFTVAQEILALPIPITISVLPQRKNSTHIANAANQQRREVMLHLPMQARSAYQLGAGGLTVQHSYEELEKIIADNLDSVPHTSGVNNHMGSLFTSNPEAMQRVFNVLQAKGDYYFVDSRTHKTTQAEDVARNTGLRTTRRNVFLDNKKTEQHIRSQLEKVLQHAKKEGSAIAIGHPYSSTIRVLREVLAKWQEQGVKLLPVSELIAYQTQRETWPKSLSHSPKVAKNSKQ